MEVENVRSKRNWYNAKMGLNLKIQPLKKGSRVFIRNPELLAYKGKDKNKTTQMEKVVEGVISKISESGTVILFFFCKLFFGSHLVSF